ncbi:Uncharacterized OsmC-related protein [Andreprevotia lacus DSM 23236]|jgi:uncharacterized OsmC-like protein|uniref:Uncharacterized OsmC-related protein n=1 Tax=Andreprevotia lacus DSM 23236 TaxID=1121001 RepID=A0A1W1XF59_9NEIS|nr:OsmC family protein [Andreprevotia lacus]SMC22583.1 Uncharacterized OsmC-related protein [Andreprevotia lacus DSM 23236]
MSHTIHVDISRAANGRQQIRSRNAVAEAGRAADGSDADDAFRAGELLLGALGACTAGTVWAYARQHGITALEEVRVHVAGDEETAPSRIARIRVEVQVSGALSEVERDRLQRAAHACKIHNTLRHLPEISVGVSLAEAPVSA